MHNGNFKLLPPAIAATIVEYAEKLDTPAKTENSAFHSAQHIFYHSYKNTKKTECDVFANAMDLYWQKRIEKEKGEKVLNAFQGLQYSDCFPQPIEHMTAREFYMAGDLMRDAIIFKKISALGFLESDKKSISQALDKFDAWIANSKRDFKKHKDLRAEFDAIIKNLINMDNYIDSRFYGNILCEAIYHQYTHLFNALLDAPWIDIDAQDRRGNSVLYFLLYTREFYVMFGRSSSTSGIIQGFDHMLDTLLERGVKVDKAGRNAWTPLMYAAASGSVKCVKTLLAAGADIHLTYVDEENHVTSTALDVAKKYKRAEIVDLLEAHAEELGQSSPSRRI